MEFETIEKTLKERFSAVLPDFHKRRIIFWHDPEGDFGEMFDELDIPDVKPLKLTDTNNFYAKMLLAYEDTESNYLVYNPISYDNIQDNWLLDIELQSESFRADMLSMRMNKMDMPETVSMRRAMKRYNKFFSSKERTAKLEALGKCLTDGQLHINILTVLTGADNNTMPAVIRRILSDGLELDENKSFEAIGKFGDVAILWELITRYTGYVHSEDSQLWQFAAHLLLSAQSGNMKASAIEGLEEFVSSVHSTNCYNIIHLWMRSDDDDALYEAARAVEENLNLVQRFDKLEISELSELECFPCINECILRRYMTEISDNIIKAEDIAAAVEKRRTLKWYKRVKYYYDGLLQIANMQRFYQNHISGFHEARYADLWKKYTGEYYLMDTYYRLFHTAFRKCIRQSTTVLEDLYKSVADYAENLYKNWYLRELNGKWSALLAEEYSESYQLVDIPQQENFYRNYVSSLSEQSRVFVIISDAFRYEVGAELNETLLRETKGNAELTALQSFLPSVTKFGMAALLPHRKLEITNDMKMTCDGMSTEGTENREKVLKAFDSDSIAIAYKKLIAMTKAERQEYFKGVKIAYIYHNQIDAAGDKPTTEDEVFDACEESIIEIKNIVRMITSELNGTNIFITADHGFLYSYKPLEEYDKSSKNSVSGNIAELERRYIISCNAPDEQDFVNIDLSRYSQNYHMLAPMECIRIKKQGGGMNYVHGGISLQEMCVPVVAFKNIKTSSKNYVETTNATLTLLSQSRKISNSIFNLDFYQKEIVGGKVLPVTYELSIKSAAGKTVSDRKTVIADKASENNAERTFKVRFVLKSLEYKKTEPYYLVIKEKGKTEPIEKIEFNIDVAFVDDFGF